MYIEDVLEHHGVKGMHWGISTQHLSTTKEGIDATSNLVKSVGSIHDSVRKTRSNTGINKDSRLMSDADLRAKVNRMNLEKQYSTLSKERVSNGEDRVKKILDTTGNVLAIGSSSLAIALAIRKLRV